MRAKSCFGAARSKRGTMTTDDCTRIALIVADVPPSPSSCASCPKKDRGLVRRGQLDPL